MDLVLLNFAKCLVNSDLSAVFPNNPLRWFSVLVAPGCVLALHEKITDAGAMH
jgi:hypothetical protein